MKPRERVLAALHHEEADHVPTGENQVDGKLVEEILQRTSLYNARWRPSHCLQQRSTARHSAQKLLGRTPGHPRLRLIPPARLIAAYATRSTAASSARKKYRMNFPQ